ncbi:metalloprotease [Rhizobium sp. Root1203]|uniref:AprI/Inh family metalloprotease inhibitor n=1 Tax=Rhizobium sp. Root1203 TaxID=1736427 RepID=UPI00071060B7|nr:AprI/Inh family metalloprotease inhibitor [Rhizobium sp. Root1203]KQV13415.1 metalloprotease [Rhizobium sp. Root1203]
MIRFALPPAAMAAVGLLACGSAFADDVDADIVKAQAGTYLIAPASGAPGCRIALGTDNATGGYSLTGEENCTKPLPAFAEAYSWNFDENGGVIIIDAARKVLARFIENEGSPLKTEGDEPLLLIEAPKGVDRLPTVKSLAGNWTLQRPAGEKLCMLVLGDDIDEDGNAPLSPSGDCTSAVAKLKLAVFHVEGFGIVLMSRDGASISLDMLPDGSFQKSPEEGGKPLLMVRKP